MDQIDPVSALRHRAQEAGVTMADICAEAGVAQSTPSRWKAGSNDANLSTVRKLEEALARIIEARREAA